MTLYADGNHIKPVFRLIAVMVVILLGLLGAMGTFLSTHTGQLPIPNGIGKGDSSLPVQGVLLVLSLLCFFPCLGAPIVCPGLFSFIGIKPLALNRLPLFGLFITFIGFFPILSFCVLPCLLTVFRGASFAFSAISTPILKAVAVSNVTFKVANWLRIGVLAIAITTTLVPIYRFRHLVSQIKIPPTLVRRYCLGNAESQRDSLKVYDYSAKKQNDRPFTTLPKQRYYSTNGLDFQLTHLHPHRLT